MASRGLWLRWSWRDLRRRWLVVATLAVMIALGSGVYAGFSSLAAWRRASFDFNYAQQRMHDLRVRLRPGAYAPEGSLRGAVDTIPSVAQMAAVEERLIALTQVDASTDENILVQGELVGVDLSDGGPSVNRIHVARGRPLTPDDSGRAVALLHTGFAQQRGLPATGTVRVAGGVPVAYAGHGIAPDTFTVFARSAGALPFGTAAGYAVVYASLPTVQALSGQSGSVNDLVLTLVPGADRARVQRELEAALARRLPDVSVTVTTTDDDPGYRTLYEDIENDQTVITLIAMLVLGGAALAAFNLTSRMVEAQRREIGIGMALGVPPAWLAVRPLLFGAQVALLGAVAGIPIGLAVGEAVKGVLQDFLALPEWRTPFPVATYARAAGFGFVLPFLATAYPVWRALRVEPVTAIRTGLLAARSGGLAPLARQLPFPGGSTARMPLRNLLRTPRRTLLTALAIGAAVVALVAVLGLLDSFDRAINRATAEAAHGSPHRIAVLFDGFLPDDDPRVRAIAANPAVARVDLGLRLEGTLIVEPAEVEVILDLLDLTAALWTPTLTETAAVPATEGIVLARKAAADLGLRPGDTVTLRHVRRDGAALRTVETPIRIAAIHAGPVRLNAYLDLGWAQLFGLEGTTNMAQVAPATGVTADQFTRMLFDQPVVTAIQPVDELGRDMRDLLSQLSGILTVAEVAVLLIALLIGFNATNIAADERAREHATMFAFGVPVRTVVGISVAESALTGLLGTLVGIPLGFVVVRLLIERVVQNTVPDLGIEAALAGSTLAVALVMGIVVVAVTPLFTARRMQRLDIPATLRVVE